MAAVTLVSLCLNVLKKYYYCTSTLYFMVSFVKKLYR